MTCSTARKPWLWLPRTPCRTRNCGGRAAVGTRWRHCGHRPTCRGRWSPVTARRGGRTSFAAASVKRPTERWPTARRHPEPNFFLPRGHPRRRRLNVDAVVDRGTRIGLVQAETVGRRRPFRWAQEFLGRASVRPVPAEKASQKDRVTVGCTVADHSRLGRQAPDGTGRARPEEQAGRIESRCQPGAIPTNPVANRRTGQSGALEGPTGED